MDCYRLVEEEKVIQRVKGSHGTQQALAKALKISPSLLNAYFNENSPMPWSVAAQIEVITAKKWGYDQRVTVFQIMSLIKAKDRAAVIALAKLQATAKVSPMGLSLGDRALLVDHLRTYTHGGSRRKDEFQVGNCKLEQAIKEAGLSGINQYYRIKHVLLQGTPELIAAMNNERLSISMAAFLATLPAEQQQVLLQLKRKALMVAVKALKDKAKH